jgi:2,4-dienoyl-CoA reductase-like NADH-dependent reductase (Old Yellow Enzyme family)
MKRVVNFCKAHGVAKTAIQLAHAGRKASCTPRTTVLGRLSDRWGSGSAPLTGWRAAPPSKILSSIPLLTVSTIIVHTIPHLTSGLGYSHALAGVLFGP